MQSSVFSRPTCLHSQQATGTVRAPAHHRSSVTCQVATQEAQQEASSTSSALGGGPKTVRTAVMGASGYTGEEVVRLLSLHPMFAVSALTADSQAGKAYSDIYPHLVTATKVPNLVKIADVDWNDIDAAFCCLPHATTQEVIASLPSHLKIVDLSADFRLQNVDTYREWYGGEHKAPKLQQEAVYGLTEIYREEIKKARLIANPGCYPTSVQLPLYPLLAAGLIQTEDIIVDAKSGVSGAGRSAKVNLLYTEIAEGINSYGVSAHRHMPEIEQGLTDAAKVDVTISFTPHLMPMTRGMQSTIYVKLAGGATIDELRTALKNRYDQEPFVTVLPEGTVPHTRYVRGSNHVHMSVFPDRLKGRAIIICVLDNLVKGASGQAIQNLNLISGIPETTGLLQAAMFP
ncbi:hypothetical protein WJX84_005092 [Apatococcus fuscideae]|uniref:Probable N-acetyl-gamma-glutamyl-phosphate reductase, chloroplastic n=1 Tax=Apatococcus fuscideae TaxID=2026836 RepID=A0AAW1RL93_9CHLO